ncbi:hypothetical protein [Undibacterium sp. TC9W]|uniref:hypothetical protein n=1 Tax=Undibacterium sp. TC9W TaxID=3413053 RepID=UPI003BF36F8F
MKLNPTNALLLILLLIALIVIFWAGFKSHALRKEALGNTDPVRKKDIRKFELISRGAIIVAMTLNLIVMIFER